MSRLMPLIDAIIRDDFVALASLAAALPPDELNSALLRCFMFSDDPAVLPIILDAGANIDHQDAEGRTAIFLAVKYTRTEIVQLLISRGCNVNLGKYNQSNCLHLAARRGSVDILRALLTAGHQRDAVNWGGNTAVLIACRFGQTDAVEALLAGGCNMSLPNKLGHYPLHYAAFTGDARLVAVLRRHGAHADVRTHLGITPIMLACERKHRDVVEALAPHCDLSHREQLYGGTALHWAVASGCRTCVKHLLAAPMDRDGFDAFDLSGRTPLLQAVQSRRPDVFPDLLNVVDMSVGANAMALHLAAAGGHRACVEALCADSRTAHLVNRRDCFAQTPLDLATASAVADDKPTEIVDVIDVLLRHGAERSDLVVRSPPLAHRRVCGVRVDQLGGFVATSSALQAGGNAEKSGGTAVEFNSNADLLQRANEIAARSNVHRKPSQNLAGLDDEQDISDKLADVGLEATPPATVPKPTLPVIFKTYSPVKMALIGMLRTASCEQMVAPVRFDFATWLDAGPEAFVLKVTSLDMSDWLYRQTHSAWSLRELCRGALRRCLGYRAHEKVAMLPLPRSMKDFLNMAELEEINTKDISIRSTVSYDEIDME